MGDHVPSPKATLLLLDITALSAGSGTTSMKLCSVTARDAVDRHDDYKNYKRCYCAEVDATIYEVLSCSKYASEFVSHQKPWCGDSAPVSQRPRDEGGTFLHSSETVRHDLCPSAAFCLQILWKYSKM